MRLKTKGFTLIELLVVIAIIGILASIVLVSFPGATKKANDARIVSAIAQARTIMEYVCDSQGCSAFSFGHADMTALATEIDNNMPTGGTKVINVSSDNVCISASVNVTTLGAYYCADRTGVAGYNAAGCPTTGLCGAVTSPH